MFVRVLCAATRYNDELNNKPELECKVELWLRGERLSYPGEGGVAASARPTGQC